MNLILEGMGNKIYKIILYDFFSHEMDNESFYQLKFFVREKTII